MLTFVRLVLLPINVRVLLESLDMDQCALLEGTLSAQEREQLYLIRRINQTRRNDTKNVSRQNPINDQYPGGSNGGHLPPADIMALWVKIEPESEPLILSHGDLKLIDLGNLAGQGSQGMASGFPGENLVRRQYLEKTWGRFGFKYLEILEF